MQTTIIFFICHTYYDMLEHVRFSNYILLELVHDTIIVGYLGGMPIKQIKLSIVQFFKDEKEQTTKYDNLFVLTCDELPNLFNKWLPLLTAYSSPELLLT